MKGKIIFILIIFFFVSCKQKEAKDIQEVRIVKEDKDVDQDKVVTMNAITTNYDTLINRVKKHGDTDAYDELFYSFKDCCFDESTDSVMVYSKIMAEKFNYEKAYFDYYEAVLEKYSIDNSNFPQIDISKMNKQEKLKLENWFKMMVEKKLITQQRYDSIKR